MRNAQRSDGGTFPFAFDLGDRLDKSMRVAGLTIDDMAAALDVSRGTIGNYRSGRTAPSKLQIKEWAVRTGAPLDWLMHGTEPETRNPRPEGPDGDQSSDVVRPLGFEPRTHWIRDGQVIHVDFGERTERVA